MFLWKIRVSNNPSSPFTLNFRHGNYVRKPERNALSIVFDIQILRLFHICLLWSMLPVGWWQCSLVILAKICVGLKSHLKLYDSYLSRISHLILVYNLWTIMSACVMVLVDAYAPIIFTNASFVIILFKKNSVCHYHCLLCHTLFFLMNFDAFLISKWRTLHL